MKKIGHGTKMEAHGMYSSEGEYVEFGNPVLLDGNINYETFIDICILRLLSMSTIRGCGGEFSPVHGSPRQKNASKYSTNQMQIQKMHPQTCFTWNPAGPNTFYDRLRFSVTVAQQTQRSFL